MEAYGYCNNSPIIYRDPDGRNPIVGAFVSGLIEIISQIGRHMLDGKSFNQSINMIDKSDVAWEAGAGALSGMIGDPGIGKFIKFIRKKSNRRMVNKVFGIALEYSLTIATDIAKKATNDEQIDLTEILVDGLVDAGMGELIPDTDFFKKYINRNNKQIKKLDKSLVKLNKKQNKKYKSSRADKIWRKQGERDIRATRNDILEGVNEIAGGIAIDGVIQLSELVVESEKNNNQKE